jgi:polar amino acid transport system substrate-binding protein
MRSAPVGAVAPTPVVPMPVVSGPVLAGAGSPRARARLRAAALLAAILLVSLLATGCGIPRDPEHTLERARGATLRVGVAEAGPWARRSGGRGPAGEPSGVEPALVRGFAASIDAGVEWHPGGETELLAALERFELDLVIGGLTTASPWKSRVGLTRGYYIERLEVGAPPSMARPDSIAGLTVAVRPGTPLANRVAESRAEALPAADPWATGELVAAPAWELEVHGYEPTGHVLSRGYRAMAAPPGENALVTALELYLARHEGEIESLLLAEGRP